MKSFLFFNLVAAACALHVNVCAFSSPPSTTSISRAGLARHRSSLASATVGNSDSLGSRPTKPRLNQVVKEQAELETIRKELIQKYINLGHSEDYATNEVNYFLEDSERSAQYVEMRRIAMARGNDLGIETWVQFGGAFLFGWLVSWFVNYLPILQARFWTHHGTRRQEPPIISLNYVLSPTRNRGWDVDHIIVARTWILLLILLKTRWGGTSLTFFASTLLLKFYVHVLYQGSTCNMSSYY